MTVILDRPVLNRGSSAKQPMRLGSIPVRDLGLLMALGLAHCTATAQGALAFCRGVSPHASGAIRDLSSMSE